MKIFIAQNLTKIDGLNYIPRSEEEITKELEDVKAKYKTKFKDVHFFESDRRDGDDFGTFKSKHKVTNDDVLHMSIDLGVLSTFDDTDLIIFTPYHYLDRYCNFILDVASHYKIPYEVIV